MLFLRRIFAATAVAVFFNSAQALDRAEVQFSQLQSQLQAGQSGLVGQGLVVDIDLAASDYRLTQVGEKAVWHYRMAFNQIAEGWSWQPQADAALEDYYRFKFLPLQSATLERGLYTQEDKIGEAQETQVVWRYDYFLAFDNLYDFYSRQVDDEAGFEAELPVALSNNVGLRATATLVEPVLSESTTFWKATHAYPRDLTLKKRYFVAKLKSLAVIDRTSERVLCVIEPGAAGHCRMP